MLLGAIAFFLYAISTRWILRRYQPPALGSVGLCAFALIRYKWLPSHNAYFVISIATIEWLLLVIGLWELRKRRWRPLQ